MSREQKLNYLDEEKVQNEYIKKLEKKRGRPKKTSEKMVWASLSEQVNGSKKNKHKINKHK